MIREKVEEVLAEETRPLQTIVYMRYKLLNSEILDRKGKFYSNKMKAVTHSGWT